VNGTTPAARRRAELGLPWVSNSEAERRLGDNRARTARRHSAAARARGAAPTALGTPDVPTATQGAATLGPAVRIATRLGTFQASPLAELAGTVRLGGSRRPPSPYLRCLHCECQQNQNFKAAQDDRPPTPHCSSLSRRQSTSPIRPPTPRRPHTRSPKRDSSPSPPQLSRVEAQPEK